METDVNRSILAWSGFVLSMICALISGIDMSFNVYALPLKDTFNLTQKQVEILSSLDVLGIGVGILETPFFNTFGYKVTFLLSWLMMPLASGFISMAAFHSQYFVNTPGLLYIAQLTMAIGNALTGMIVSRILFLLCPEKHSGKLVALYTAMQCLGKVVFATLIDLFFAEDLAGFFLFVSVTSSGVFGMCFIVLYLLIPDTQCTKSSEISNERSSQSLEDTMDASFSSVPEKFSTENISASEATTNTCSHLDHKSLKSTNPEIDSKIEFDVALDLNPPDRLFDSTSSVDDPLLRTKNRQETPEITPWKGILTFGLFHLVMWPAVIYYSVPFVLMNNITIISDSMAFERPMNSVYLISFCIITTRLIFGIIIDQFPSIITGLILQLIGDVCLLVTVFIGMFLLFSTTSVYVMTILTGIGLGSGFTVCASMLIIEYGKQQYNFFGGLFYVLLTVCITVNQLIFGSVYDREIEPGGGIFCYGRQCFFTTFVFFFFLIIGAMTTQTTNLIMTVYLKKYQVIK